MDSDNKKTENELEIEIENEYVEDNKLSVKEQIYEIEIKMQELDAQIELYEDALYNSEEEIFTDEKLTELKTEYKRLRSEKKLLTKQTKTNWDKIPVWMFAYGVFQVFFSFFYVLGIISAYFASWFVDLIRANGVVSKFWEISSLFIIPFISILISVIILILIKEKFRKRFFAVVFSIQLIETIISVIIVIGYLNQ